MRILFLDFDGVLNSENFLRSKRPIESLKKSGFQSGEAFQRIQKIDHMAVSLVHEFTERNDLGIVFSTTWRLAYSTKFLASLLTSLSPFNQDRFLGFTPDLGIHEKRGAEIAAWMKERSVDKFIIFDDMDTSNFLPNQRNYHVKSDYQLGLQPEHIARAETLLLT